MVDKNSPEPMYEQIAQIIRDEIEQKKLVYGRTIGTHGELAERFKVSLITVRKAIELLVNDGLLITKPGKGTYVNKIPLHDGFNRLAGMSSVIKMNNLSDDVVVREMKNITPPKSFPKTARDLLGKNCLFIERTHSIDGELVGLAQMYIPEKFGKYFSFDDVSRHTIYYLMENHLKINLGQGVQNITAVPANAKVAQALKIPEKSPVLMIERFSYSSEGEFLEYMLVFYKYDKYSFQVELKLSAE